MPKSVFHGWLPPYGNSAFRAADIVANRTDPAWSPETSTDAVVSTTKGPQDNVSCLTQGFRPAC